MTTTEQYQLEPVGELRYLAAESLDADETPLLAAPAEGPICDVRTIAADAAIRLTPKKGAYDAAIQIDATLVRGRLQQSYRVDCRPQGSGIDHVLVYLSEPSERPIQWTDARSRAPLFAERMPANDPRLRGLPPGGELWLLHLRRLYAKPVAITASVSKPWSRRAKVPLVSLPDAATQQGRVAVSTASAENPQILAQAMIAAPLPTGSADEPPSRDGATTRAVYCFQPARFYDSRPVPELWLGPAGGERLGPRLLATRVRVESRFSPDGRGVHRATYELENHGASKVDLNLPPEVKLEAARLDGEPLAITPQQKFSIPLTSRPHTVLELELSGRYPPLANGERLPSPIADGSMTILGGQWTVLLPEGFRVVDGAALDDKEFDWRQRVFGPLARPREQVAFHPFDAASWNGLWATASRATTPTAQAAPPADSSNLLGWHAFRRDFVAGPPTAISVARPASTSAWGAVVFLVCAAGARLGRLRAVAAVLLASIAASIALFLPITVAPLAMAAALGLAVAALWQWTQQLIGVGRAGAVLAAIAVVLSAASGAADAAPSPRKVERVLVPVDSNGKAAGTKYFVSESFLSQLLASSKHGAADDWLLTGMYVDGGGDEPPLGRWSLAFDLDVLARDATIDLPLWRQEADWPAAALLDGLPAPIRWDSAGRRCTIRVAEPGHYRLSLAFQPHGKEVEGRRQLTLHLPPMIGAALRVVGGARPAELQCTGGSLARQDAPGQLVWEGELDGSGRVVLSWLETGDSALAGTTRQVDELQWLRIESDGTRLDAKFVLPNGAAWPEAIEIAVPDDWQWVDRRDALAADQSAALPDGRHLIRVRTADVRGDDDAVSLRFRRRQSSPLGRICPPAIDMNSLPVGNRWLAVSADPSLEAVPSQENAATNGGAASFIAAWGASGQAAPQVLVNAGKLDPNWYLSVRPRSTASTSRDQLSLAAMIDRLEIAYQAEVAPQGADRFGWSLTVPAKLVIEDVTATAAGAAVPLDWVRVAPNRVNIFFSQPIDKSYRLRLDGQLPLKLGVPLALPRIAPARQPATTQAIALYRDPDVLVDWQFAAAAPGRRSPPAYRHPLARANTLSARIPSIPRRPARHRFS